MCGGPLGPMNPGGMNPVEEVWVICFVLAGVSAVGNWTAISPVDILTKNISACTICAWISPEKDITKNPITKAMRNRATTKNFIFYGEITKRICGL